MIYKAIFIVSFLSLSIHCSGQYIKLENIGNWLGQKVQITEQIYFGDMGGCWFSDCDTYIQFGKSSNKYIVRIMVENVSEISKIVGDFYLFTGDGSRIKCFDKGYNYNIKRDGVQCAECFYILTNKEFLTLDKEDVSEIHFNIETFNEIKSYALTKQE